MQFLHGMGWMRGANRKTSEQHSVPQADFLSLCLLWPCWQFTDTSGCTFCDTFGGAASESNIEGIGKQTKNA